MGSRGAPRCGLARREVPPLQGERVGERVVSSGVLLVLAVVWGVAVRSFFGTRD
jgi:hypothetical protein